MPNKLLKMIILFNKPFNCLSQFTEPEPGSARQTLADFIDIPGVYAAGRLDRDSEGLMVLTDQGRLQARLSHPKFKAPKTYFVQVEGQVSDAALHALREGVTLKDGPTQPAQAEEIAAPDWLWARVPPIRERKTVPDCWLKLTLREGRNRQIRRMTAHVGHPTLRLIRYSIDRWTLEDLAPGSYRKLA